MCTPWRRILSDTRGGLIAEFAAAMPVLVLMLLGGVEVSRYAMLNQKMDRLTTTMGDLVAQAETLTTAELDQLFLASEHVAWPFDIKAKGSIIITSISRPPPAVDGDPPGPQTITWQRASGGLVAASQIGAVNGAPALPDVLDGAEHTIIAAEVYFQFTPLLVGALVPATRLYHRAFFRPRIGSLTTLG